MATKTTIILGHCGYDGPRLGKIAEKAGLKTIDIDASDDAISFMRNNKVALVLVNRIFINGEEGLPFIEHAVRDFPQVKFMLISNFDEAQQQAQSFGAVKGFGKQAIDNPETIKIIQQAIK